MRALIFDFDGVIADSEAISNAVLAEKLTEEGLPTTLEQSLERYCGRSWSDVYPRIEQRLGRSLPGDFRGRLHAATFARFEAELREVEGAAAFINEFIELPRCIASSSPRDRIDLCLRRLSLVDAFGDRVVTAEDVVRGKPFPDIFLLAAERLGAEPETCLVIEDSASGVRAAVAAGMACIGLCAGSHIRIGHADALQDAGARHVAHSWREVARITREIVGWPP